MSRIKSNNSFVNKVIIIIIVFFALIFLFLFCYKVLIKDYKLEAFDLGEKENVKDYNDTILTSYSSYVDLMNKYDLEPILLRNDFDNNYYLAVFQEYDPCGESEFKTVRKVEINEKIKITFLIHNKCGWCKKHLALHIIKIDKINESKEIEYDYEYARTNNCGTISKN